MKKRTRHQQNNIHILMQEYYHDKEELAHIDNIINVESFFKKGELQNIFGDAVENCDCYVCDMVRRSHGMLSDDYVEPYSKVMTVKIFDQYLFTVME